MKDSNKTNLFSLQLQKKKTIMTIQIYSLLEAHRERNNNFERDYKTQIEIYIKNKTKKTHRNEEEQKQKEKIRNLSFDKIIVLTLFVNFIYM